MFLLSVNREVPYERNVNVVAANRSTTLARGMFVHRIALIAWTHQTKQWPPTKQEKTTCHYLVAQYTSLVIRQTIFVSMSYGQTQSTLWGPHSLVLSAPSAVNQSDERPNCIEVSIHTLPRQLQREFQHVFDERNLNLDPIIRQHTSDKQQLLGPLEFLAIPTNQHAREDLVAVGDKIEAEKDRLLNVFMQFARAICEQLRAQGYWADFIDPCSGLPSKFRKGSTHTHKNQTGMICH